MVQVYFQWRRSNRPTLFYWSDVSINAAYGCIPFQHPDLLGDSSSAYGNMKPPWLFYVKCSKGRAVPPPLFIPVPLKGFILMRVSVCYIPSHLDLSLCSCKWSALLILIQSFFNTSVLTQSCHFHIGLVIFLYLHTSGGWKRGASQLQELQLSEDFSQESLVSVEDPSNWGLS